MALPKPPAQEDAPDFNPFLTVKEIGGGKVGATATVLAVGARDEIVKGQFGDQIVVEVKHGTKLYDLGVNLDRPNYRILFGRFGKNPRNWRGKITLRVQAPRQKGFNNYIAVVDDDRSRAKPAAKRRTTKKRSR